jgi:integrase
MQKIDSPTSRGRLAPRREPYWCVLGRGQAVGYRAIEKATTSPKKPARGTWIARHRNEEGRQQYESLGELADYVPGERFEVACSKARIWFDKCRGGMTEVVTVSMACGEYLKDLQLRKGPSAKETAKVRITAHIEKQLGNKRVDRLTLAGLKRWRDGLVITSDDLEMKRASMSSANRTAGVLKAALNHSARLHKIVDRTAWQDLKPFHSVDGVRDIYLTQEQVARLLETTTGSLNALIKAGLLSGARLSELTDATVADVDAGQGTLQVSGKTGKRTMVLSVNGKEFFTQHCKNKLPKAWLLPRDDGSQWDRRYLAMKFRKAVQSAKLPAGTTFYCLRHWYISKALSAGMDIELLARNVGNSAAIIRKHYHKFLQDDMRKQVNKLVITI